MPQDDSVVLSLTRGQLEAKIMKNKCVYVGKRLESCMKFICFRGCRLVW